MDIAKLLIERLLSWPIAVLILGWLFREPLSGFLMRMHTVKGAGIEVTASQGSAVRQLETAITLERDSLAVQISPQAPLPIPEEIEKEQAAIRAYGGTTDIVVEQISLVEAHLNRLRMPLGTEDTARVLVRHLAVTQLLYRAEALFRQIFGSQIATLRRLNESPGREADLRPYYESARAESTAFYGDYSFESWLSFLVQQGCVLKREGPDEYHITIWGQRFLEFLVHNRLATRPY
jgi:hypothetical protein